MTITATATSPTPVRTTAPALWRPALVVGIAASAATAALAATAHAAGVSLDVDGEPIPVLGFANLTFICVALGYLLAIAVRRWAARPRHTFVVTTLGLTALSFLPDLMVPDTAPSTRLVLMATHVVAAAIVIPAIASRLSENQSR